MSNSKRTKRHPILLGKAEVIDPPIRHDVKIMLENEGLYIATAPILGRAEAPLVSMGGKIYALDQGKELPPESFIEGSLFYGPYRAPTK
jgi:hypothetical protein